MTQQPDDHLKFTPARAQCGTAKALCPVTPSHLSLPARKVRLQGSERGCLE
jgi:hypothetical protein